MALVVVLGGARSGKSSLAQRLASAFDGSVTFIATAEARDEEMADRIANHRAPRPPGWITIEEPIDVVGAPEAAPPHARVGLYSLTPRVANLPQAGWTAEPSAREGGGAP